MDQFRQIIVLLVTLQISSAQSMTKEFDEIFAQTIPKTASDVQASAAWAVINRTVPSHAHLFSVTIDTNLPLHTFLLHKTSEDDSVLIKATSGVIACKGFYHYLKYYCNSHVSWDGSRINMPDSLPDVNVTETSRSRFTYYQNVCTWSYSFVWWQWSDWQRHIDWMAMQGITLTIAPVQETVWRRIYVELGLTHDEIADHFSGPAFLAWQRMGLLRGFAGPLPISYMNRSSWLQKQIISAYRNLGIAFALPAFAGHVPRSFKRIFPNATFSSMRTMYKFSPMISLSLIIDPSDPLFKKVGKLFLSKIIEEFGEGNHIYFSDPFNKNDPTNQTIDHVSNVSQMVYKTMKEIDPHAIWMLQSWVFLNPIWSDEHRKALLTAVPTGRILVLDLHAEILPQYTTTKSFHGQPFIWCMLHNFGGALGMHGSLEVVNQEVFKARNFANSSMIGVGITPEGINQNYVMYEFVLDRAWDQLPTNISKWINEYTINRYGIDDHHIQNAWQILTRSVYAYKGPSYRNLTILCKRPSLHISPWTWYNLTLIDDALDEFLKTPADLIADNDLFKYDLVDVTRQFLQNKIELIYPRIKKAFDSKDLDELKRIQIIFESILIDLDDILQTNENFLLGKWLESARLLATNQIEEQLYEYNARNQITTWGPKGEIVDYANKQWAGLVRDYCLPRWRLLFQELEQNIVRNKEKFNDSKCQEKIFKQIEEPFTVARNVYRIEAEGNTWNISRDIFRKWRGNNAFISMERTLTNWVVSEIFCICAIWDIICFCAIVFLWRMISNSIKYRKRKAYTAIV